MKRSMEARFEGHRRERTSYWDAIACQLDTWTGWGGAYHRRLTQVYRFLVSPGQRVLELGCGLGDLLAALEPAYGVGVDFSPRMLERARQRHPALNFILADVHDLSTVSGPFDIIVLSDIANEVWDVQTVLEQLRRLSHSRTRLIINNYSRLWEIPLAIAKRLGLGKPTLGQNWLAPEDMANLLGLAHFEAIRQWSEVLLPIDIPLISNLANRILAKLWPFSELALTTFFLARPRISPESCGEEPSVSIVIPARTEAGNIPQIFDSMPEMGRRTELVFVEGHSQDNTYSVIEQQIAKHPERQCQLHRQAGAGKGDAVRCGLSHANGDVFMIFDADLTVPFQDLPRFFRALCTGQGEFINGVRLVYPMQDNAMRSLNLWGNKAFSVMFSWLLGQPIKDTLCGTKVLWRKDYEMIAANRSYFGEFDPFGDYDLIFGAAKIGLKIVDLPVHYQARSYGSTNIQRWKHGWLLLRMVLFAAGRLKFV